MSKICSRGGLTYFARIGQIRTEKATEAQQESLWMIQEQYDDRFPPVRREAES